MTATSDMVVAITGASRGIGAATARLLAGRGAAVVLGARSEADLVGWRQLSRLAAGEWRRGRPTSPGVRTCMVWSSWLRRSSAGSTSW